MPRSLLIDLEADRVELRKTNGKRLHLSGRWLEFYALLAAHSINGRQDTKSVRAEELHLVGRWLYKRPQSVGKIVARHLSVLAENGFDRFITFPPRKKLVLGGCAFRPITLSGDHHRKRSALG